MFKTLKRIPYKIEILILIAIPVITTIEWLHMDILSYRGGLNGSPSWGFILMFIYEPLKIAVVILAVFRFVYVKHVKSLNKYFNAALLSFLIFIGSWIIPYFCLPSGAFFFLKGYEKWIEKNVDVKAIQTWLLSGEVDKYMGNRYGDNFPNDFPDFITNFEPEFISFHGVDSERGKSIVIETGLGLDIWGIVIGLPTTKTIKKGRIKKSASYVEFRRPIMPGVYIFYGG